MVLLWWCVVRVVLSCRSLVVGAGSAAFVLDQLGEPADLAVDRLEAVLVQLAGVAVDALARCGPARCFMPSRCLLDPAAATLEDLQPDVRAGLGEERQPRAEALVVEGVGTDVGEQLGEVLLAVGGEPVDPLAAPRPAGRRASSSGASSEIQPASDRRRRVG